MIYSNYLNIGLVFIFLSCFICCQKSYQKKITNKTDNEIADFFINTNKSIIEHEERKIDSLLAKINIPFSKDSTGIRVFVNKSSMNNDSLIFPQTGSVVNVAYNCFVFDGIQNVSNSILTDTISFKIGYSKQMRGLNHGIKLLQIGDNAKIIIPSYLGFGMSGYGKAVPPYSTLLLNVKLLNIE